MKQITESLNNFRKKHPDLPMWLSITALIASIVMPILREFLEGKITLI